MESQLRYIVRIATSEDHKYAIQITNEMAYSAAKRGVNIMQRTPRFIRGKINKGLAVIAINPDNGEWAGFGYIEVWRHKRYVANSGLIVSPKYRGIGVSTALKSRLFEYSRAKFPQAKLFSLTTSPAVMHVNASLGYKEVLHAELMCDKQFVKGCRSRVDFIGLMNNEKTKSRYVAMVYSPLAEEVNEPYIFKMKKHFLSRTKSVRKEELEVIPLHY